MKILILFRTEDGRYFTSNRTSRTDIPPVGYSYLLNGEEFDVVKVLEPLGTAGGNQQLLELIGRDKRNPTDAAGAMASMTSLDKAPAETKLITLTDEPDVVVLVRLAKAKKQSAKTVRLGELSFRKSDLVVGEPAKGRGTRKKPTSRKK